MVATLILLIGFSYTKNLHNVKADCEIQGVAVSFSYTKNLHNVKDLQDGKESLCFSYTKTLHNVKDNCVSLLTLQVLVILKFTLLVKV